MGFVLFVALTTLAVVAVHLAVRFWRQHLWHDRPDTMMRSSFRHPCDGPPLHTDGSNIAIGINRKWILSEIPLLDDLHKTLGEVIGEVPDIVLDVKAAKQTIGQFRLDGFNTESSRLIFNDPDLTTDNTMQIIAKFYDVLVSVNKIDFQALRLIDVSAVQGLNIKIPTLEIKLHITLQEKKDILVSLAKDGISLPSLQVTPKHSIVKLATSVVDRIAPRLVSPTLDGTVELWKEIADAINPWFEAGLRKAIDSAIKDNTENIIPDGLDKISFPLGDGKLTNSISLNGLTSDNTFLWMRGACQLSAQVAGKPDRVPHLPRAAPAQITMPKDTNIAAVIDTSVVNQLMDVCFHVTPDASTTCVAELEFGNLLSSIIQHLPGWKIKHNCKLACQVKSTVDPPFLVASDTDLYASIHGNTTLAIDEKDANGETSSVTLLQAQLNARADVAGPTYDPTDGIFHFELISFKILGITFTDYHDSKMSHWVSHFLDHVLKHEDHRRGFEHWWEVKGKFIDKCEYVLNMFGENLCDRLRRKVHAAIEEGRVEANKFVDEQLSQFVLPTAGLSVLGHQIHIRASSIVVNKANGLFKIIGNLDVKDVTTRGHTTKHLNNT